MQTPEAKRSSVTAGGHASMAQALVRVPNLERSERDAHLPSNQLQQLRRTPPPLRILMLVSAFRCIGGVQENVDHLAAEFIRRRHTVAILTDRHKLDSPERTPLAAADLTSLHIPTQSPASWRHLERLVKWPSEIAAAEERLANHIRIWRPDIVNCHEWHWDRFPLIARACKRAGSPLVFTVYDTCGRGNLGNKPLRCLDSAAALATVSLSSKSAIQRFLRRPEYMQVIYPGVDTTAAPVATDYGWPRPYIFSAGRLQLAHKAFDLLISSFAALAPSYPSVDLLIAGNGPDRPRLEKAIEQSGLGSRIHALGAVSRQELWRLYKGSLFFAMPSRMFEGLGMVFLEAMASAKAVIGTSIGGVAEVVSDGQTGALIKENDANALAASLKSLLDNPQQAERMGQKGRELVTSRFSWPQAAGQYLALYDAHRAAERVTC